MHGPSPWGISMYSDPRTDTVLVVGAVREKHGRRKHREGALDPASGQVSG